MAKTIADQLVALGLVTAERAEEILEEVEPPEILIVASRTKRKANKVPGCPNKRKCVACGNNYEYIRRGNYPGKSPKRCPKCQLRLSNPIVTNMGARPKGHKTRQQHKHVRPSKE